MTNSDDTLIRDVLPGDIQAIQEIYARHVLDGLASFEEVPPDVDEIARRYHETLENGYPYRLAERNGRIVGYAYAGSFRPRRAYRYTVENSIYLDTDELGRGTGQKLLSDLIDRCTEMGFRQMMAVIGDSENKASIGLHAKLGFKMIGISASVGFKHGRWVDQVLMQRVLGEGDTSLP